MKWIMIAVFRTHSSLGTQQSGTGQYWEFPRAALTQGFQCCDSVYSNDYIIQEDELCREDSEEEDWEDDLPSHIF